MGNNFTGYIHVQRVFVLMGYLSRGKGKYNFRGYMSSVLCPKRIVDQLGVIVSDAEGVSPKGICEVARCVQGGVNNFRVYEYFRNVFVDFFVRWLFPVSWGGVGNYFSVVHI